MSQDRFGAYVAVINAINLQQLLGYSVRPEATKDYVIPAGNLDSSANVLNFADPAVTITTDDILTALTNVSVSAGLAVTAAKFQYQKRADGGTFSAGSVHTTLTATKGFLFARSLSVNQDEQEGAKLELEFRALWDGTSSGTPALPNAPLLIDAAAALASTPAFLSRYYLGPIYLGATPLEGVVGYRIDFGITFNSKRADGDLYARVGSIFRRLPVITFQCLKTSYLSTIAHLFNADPGAALTFYLTRGVHGGGRVAYATASHAKIAMATGCWSPDAIEVTGEQDTTVSVTCNPTGVVASTLGTAIP